MRAKTYIDTLDYRIAWASEDTAVSGWVWSAVVFVFSLVFLIETYSYFSHN